MNVIINPGSGPVRRATEEHAAVNVTVFSDEVTARGRRIINATRRPDADTGDGRFTFDLATEDGHTIEVQMPGLPIEQVRFVDGPDQNIWHFPRLYIDGSSWVWMFALSACLPDDDH